MTMRSWFCGPGFSLTRACMQFLGRLRSDASKRDMRDRIHPASTHVSLLGAFIIGLDRRQLRERLTK